MMNKQMAAKFQSFSSALACTQGAPEPEPTHYMRTSEYAANSTVLINTLDF